MLITANLNVGKGVNSIVIVQLYEAIQYSVKCIHIPTCRIPYIVPTMTTESHDVSITYDCVTYVFHVLK